MNWKYGGFNQVGPVKYNVVPNTARYVPGICSMHVHEYETWDSINGNVGEHDSKYQVTVNPKDGSGNAIFDTTGDQWASDSVPYVLNAYYDSLIFTPESQGGDYIQFQLGDQHWSTDQASNTAKCDVGGWNKALKPIVSLSSRLLEMNSLLTVFLASRYGLHFSMLRYPFAFTGNGMDSVME